MFLTPVEFINRYLFSISLTTHLSAKIALFGFAFNKVEISFWSNKLHEIFSKFKDKTRNVYRENKFYKYTKKV